METLARFFKMPPTQSFFLFGPRGTGKTTLIRNSMDSYLFVDLLQPETFNFYAAKPERLRDVLMGNPDKKGVLLDEIQRLPALLNVVHALIEEKKGWQFILTGSSARKLKRHGVDLLAGRALLRHLHPFVSAELGALFSLDRALKIGLLPVVVGAPDPDSALSAYVTLYVREEVQQEGLTRNIGNFYRFLETASFSHACVVNISNIARECQLERKIVEGYLTILEDLLLAYRIPVFSRRAKRVMANHPKFYFADAGIFRVLRPKGSLDNPDEIGGCALEGLIGQHLRAWIDYQTLDATLSYWRTSSGNEVDFVVYGENVFAGIEVKNSQTVRPQDLHGLRAFGEDYPSARQILVYRGRERMMRDNVLIIPAEDFLNQLFISDWAVPRLT